MVKDLYLMLYNGGCCVGWAMVLISTIQTFWFHWKEEDGLLSIASSKVYGFNDTSWWLTVVQLAAILEIIHAALGLVRSPVMVTFMQVSSRIVALYAIVFSTQAQGKKENDDAQKDEKTKLFLV